jgi:acyl-CoA synthetase (AMP-forming)/AMP-acid ligase II
MQGLMQDHPLLISGLLTHAARNCRQSGILAVERDASGQSTGRARKTTYPDLARRAASLAHALTDLGIQSGDRIATLAWNDQRHYELYFAISGIGAVCHTINPRLFPDQISYIIRHAQDRWIFIDPTLMPVLERVAAQIAGVPAGIVVMADHVPDTPLKAHFDVLAYEELVADRPTTFDWPVFDENTASGLCYTSGTTGNPKGVLYSHRSTVLHAWSIALPGAISMHPADVILPIVPMFHVNAWGSVYAATMTGANLAMPGPRLDGKGLFELIEAAGVTYVAGVPTVWLGLLAYLRESGKKLPDGLRGVCGGSALPAALVEAFWTEHGVRVDHGWGMTELSPVGAYNTAPADLSGLTVAEIVAGDRKQGRPPYGIELKIIGADGNELPRDGETQGELCVRGPWVTSGYYNDDDANAGAFTADGWFRTGDVATIDQNGDMEIVDRVKDLIKSGGEWISSIELENLAMTHTAISQAAAVPARHPKWDERPILVAVREADAEVSEADLVAHLEKTLSKWMLPDAVVFVDELPLTATGKVMKRALRETYADYLERQGLDQRR